MAPGFQSVKHCTALSFSRALPYARSARDCGFRIDFYPFCIRLLFAMLEFLVMARRPSFSRDEKVWSRQDLKEITRNLLLLSEPAVREFYQRAYRACAIINSSTFPRAQAIQELVQAWKQMRKWRMR
jgi:hypothetical protein